MTQEKIKSSLRNYLFSSSFLREGLLLVFLLLVEFSIMPLTFGPDRRIHDPAVYRLQDASYMSNDWYTEMAVESGVYTFYAGLIQAGSFVAVSEEAWRMMLYIACLVVLYVYLIRITKLFASTWLVVPLVVILHALLVTAMPPAWLYGYYIHVDGGFAPRSVAMALSIAALYYLLTAPRYLPWLLLGIATLIHVSNAFITFVLFLAAWMCTRLWREFWEYKKLSIVSSKVVVKDMLSAISLYVVSGGWFIVQVFLVSLNQESTFSSQKFIWTWIYFRAPYMALPLTPVGYWVVFVFHVAVLFLGGWLLRKWYYKQQALVDLLLGVGFFALCGFGAFYVFTFIFPWLPGFQFYSLRLVYLLYFIAHLFTGLFCIAFIRKLWQARSLRCLSIPEWGMTCTLFVFLGIVFWLCPVFPGTKFVMGAPKNLKESWQQALTPGPKPPESATAMFLTNHPEPFLAPPDWNGTRMYAPSVASFKTFGFTKEGLEEWYKRMDRISRGELETLYLKQSKKEKYKPVKIDWKKSYESLTTEEIQGLSNDYQFKLFLSYKEKEYPFELVAEDAYYRLYRLSSELPQ